MNNRAHHSSINNLASLSDPPPNEVLWIPLLKPPSVISLWQEVFIKRWLYGLILSVLLFLCFSLIVAKFTHAATQFSLIIISLLACYAIGLRLNQLKHSDYAACLSIVSSSAAIYLLTLIDPESANIYLNLLSVGCFLCSFLFSLRTSLIFLGITLIIILTTLFTVPNARVENIVFSAIFVLVTSALFMVMMLYRQNLDQQNHAILQQRNEYLSTLHHTALSLMKRQPLNSVLETILQNAANLMQTEHGSIDLVNADETRLIVKVGIGIHHQFVNVMIEKGQGHTGLVWQTGHSVVINNYEEWDERIKQYDYLNIHAIAGVPLKVDGKVQGVLAITHARNGRRFSQVDIEHLQQFADLAALAIDSAQLALALTESDEKLRAIVQNTTDFIYIKDMQGRYSMLNPAMASFFGQKADELIGQDDHMLFNVQDAETIRAIDHEVLQTRQLHHYENTLSMNSQAYTLLTTQFPYISSSGELQGIIGISRDITARQKSEQALKDYNKTMIDLLNASISINSAPNLDTVLAVLTEVAGIIFPESKRISVQLTDPSQQSLRTQYASLGIDKTPPLIFNAQQGIAGYAYDERRIINVSDVMSDSRFLMRPGELVPPYRSLIVAPLIADDKVWGTLSISHSRVNAFDKRSEAIVDILSRQAAVIIEKVRLFEAEKAQRHLAEALRETAAALHSASSLDTILQQILVHVGRVVPHDAANIMFLDEAHETVQMVRLHGYPKDMLENAAYSTTFMLKDFPNLLHIQQSKQALVVSDTLSFTGWFFREEVSWIRSHICAPILDSQHHILGFLNLDHAEAGHFRASDGEKLMSFANQVGIAIEKTRLFEAEQKQRDIADTLRDIGLVLTSAISRDDLLLQFLKQVARVVPYITASVWLQDKDGKTRLITGVGYEQFNVIEQLKNIAYDADSPISSARFIEARHPIIISDTQKDPTIFQGFEWIKSWAGVPIIVRDLLHGYIALDHTEPNFYGSQHIPTLEALAAQLSIVLENAQLFEQVQHYAAGLEVRVAERTIELEKERAQLQTILGVMDEGLIYAELNPGDSRAIARYVNASFYRITGLSDDEVIGQPVRRIRQQLMPLQEFNEFEAAVDDLFVEAQLTGRSNWTGESKIYNRNHDLLDVLLSAVMVFEPESGLIWSVLVLRDISQEKTLQRQKDRFVANAAHELRTPLSNLVTRVYLLRNQADHWEEHIQAIEVTTNRLGNLAQDLIDITRYQRGIITIYPHRSDLVQLVNDVVKEQAAIAEMKNIKIRSHFAQDPIPIMADPDRFTQVITNLVVNAISYSPENSYIEISIHQTDEDATLTIQDSGIGISPENSKSIFEPFFRASEGKVSGTGLGLTISKEIVDLHGGEIWVESEVNQGSCFYVKIKKYQPPKS